MSLSLAYANIPTRRACNTLIIAHFDAHGVAFAAARTRILQGRGEDVAVISKFPETGPQGLSSGSVKQLVDQYAPQRIEIIDIPVDVRNPDAAVKTLADLAAMAPVYYYDHHETDVPFIPRLYAAGVYASIFGDNVAMASALELFSDSDREARELAIIGAVADRDASILKIVPREEVEAKYLPIANRLDVIVRQPGLVNAQTAGDVAGLLARQGPRAIPTVEYPPEALARELAGKVVERGSVALLVDWSDAVPNVSAWIPKTLEQLLLITGRSIAVAVVPGYNPRTRVPEGYDVRVLKYWLADPAVPTPEDVVREEARRQAVTGNVVGHADYVSLRLPSLEEARKLARTIYERLEGRRSAVARLVNDELVAQAVQRDYQQILATLTEILSEMRNMYQEYLQLKKRQVELLERTTEERTRYD